MESYYLERPNTCSNCGKYPDSIHTKVYAESWDAASAGQFLCPTCYANYTPEPAPEPEPADPRLSMPLKAEMLTGLGLSRLKTLNKNGIVTVNDMLQPAAQIIRRTGFSERLIGSYQLQLKTMLKGEQP